MAVQTAQITVGTTAVELTGSQTDSVAGSSLAVRAPSTAEMWVGAAGVTPSTGWPVAAGQSLALDLTGDERVFAVLASGSGTAYVLRTGV